MKKISSIVALVLAASVLAGCGGGSDKADDSAGDGGNSSSVGAGDGADEGAADGADEGDSGGSGDEIPDSLAEAETDEEIYIAGAQMLLDGFGMDPLNAEQKQCFMDHITSDYKLLVEPPVEVGPEREARQLMYDDCGVERLPSDR